MALASGLELHQLLPGSLQPGGQSPLPVAVNLFVASAPIGILHFRVIHVTNPWCAEFPLLKQGGFCFSDWTLPDTESNSRLYSFSHGIKEVKACLRENKIP